MAVLDAQMPQLGGLQVVRMLRELHKAEPQKAPPAILLAHDLTSHLLREALMMHVFSVLSKPVDLNVLLDALARVHATALREPLADETVREELLVTCYWLLVGGFLLGGPRKSLGNESRRVECIGPTSNQ